MSNPVTKDELERLWQDVLAGKSMDPETSLRVLNYAESLEKIVNMMSDELSSLKGELRETQRGLALVLTENRGVVRIKPKTITSMSYDSVCIERRDDPATGEMVLELKVKRDFQGTLI